jgi:hypothetical protein
MSGGILTRVRRQVNTRTLSSLYICIITSPHDFTSPDHLAFDHGLEKRTYHDGDFMFVVDIFPICIVWQITIWYAAMTKKR